ncbi:leucine-rich repeat-containing G-protein coupled receptor 5-like isoform X2 [Mastacembelus armatus]|uniref:leucine-rich repeat-containing G-protein coupled receptor 5-like isoform X2 n=1 Tax=Mastacembelus armatus TaxID=205130 RepID=UPI000E45EBC9|nr:leucine-rich repeat-containing G-protein coupled receptor 5-like isoform X2 [Mastacembelus armatus]
MAAHAPQPAAQVEFPSTPLGDTCSSPPAAATCHQAAARTRPVPSPTMNLLLVILACLGLAGGGGVQSNCPARCRCAGVGKPQSVDCVDTGLRSVPSNLSSFTSSLDLSMNGLCALSDHVFPDLPRLHELRLGGNSLTEISRDAFTGLPALTLLNLHNNRLQRAPCAALEKLKNLRSLRLDANVILRLPASCFNGLWSLLHLWLDDNVLTEVPVLALSSLTQLQALTLALNNISSVPDRAFASLGRLLVLHLHDNQIQSLGRRSFEGLQDLETLDLSFNRIHCFPAAIRSLRGLRQLNLQNNQIPVVPVNAFTGNPAIETINFRNNPLLAVGPGSSRLLSGLSSIPEFPDGPGTNEPETRGSELQAAGVQSCADSVGSRDVSRCCLDSLVFQLLVLLSLFLTALLVLAPRGLCRSSIVNRVCCCDPGSGLLF